MRLLSARCLSAVIPGSSADSGGCLPTARGRLAPTPVRRCTVH